MFQEVIVQLKEMARVMSNDDELFSIMAGVMRKSFDALVKAGFTEEQAIRIVAGQGAGIKTN